MSVVILMQRRLEHTEGINKKAGLHAKAGQFFSNRMISRSSGGSLHYQS
jgi:hypothetical protein